MAANPKFQSWAAGSWLTRRAVRREGEALMDLVSGFAQSQMLLAAVELELLPKLAAGPRGVADLAAACDVPAERMTILCNGIVALGLTTCRRDGRYDLTVRGAALLGVPGLTQMIRHHRVLYRDLADPVALLRGGGETELARFWPYVFGVGNSTIDPAVARSYSQLMADSQTLVAEETLRAVSLRGTRRLMDVGGGTGAFLSAALAATPGLAGTLFDLPAVVPDAKARFAAADLSDRVSVVPGSFRDGALPEGADAISLVRVLYDHSDETVAALLRAARAALPPGGRLIVSEPMTGGARPTKTGDVYFALYCLAMQTGRARSAGEIAGLLAEQGFVNIENRPTSRPFLTSVVTAVNPA